MENRIKVLIADGSEAFCGHLKSELQQLDGYDLVGTAADGEEAVRLLEATKPDILVLDLMLAKRDGISVLRYANGALCQWDGQTTGWSGDFRVYYRLRSHDGIQPGCAVFDDEAL